MRGVKVCLVFKVRIDEGALQYEGLGGPSNMTMSRQTYLIFKVWIDEGALLALPP